MAELEHVSKHVKDEDLGVKGLSNLTGAVNRVAGVSRTRGETPILAEIRGIVTLRWFAKRSRDAESQGHSDQA